MFNTKVPLQKIFAYIFISFIAFILIAFFIGSDVISNLGGGGRGNPNVIAKVNNQNVYRYDYLRYRDQFRDSGMEEKESMLLDSFIARILFYQRAIKLGINVPDEKVYKVIRAFFKDKISGEFDEDMYKDYLKKSHSSLSDFHQNMKREVISDEFRKLIQMGFAITTDDVLMESRFLNADCKIQYAYIPLDDLKKSLMSKITPSELEIQTAMNKNKDKYSDEMTNRRLTTEELQEAKFNAAAKSLVDTINTMAKKGESFMQAFALLGGRVTVSPVFKLGNPVKKEDKVDPVFASISKSSIFIESCIFTEPQKTSQVVFTPEGLAIFTPIQFNLFTGELSHSDYNRISDTISRGSFEMAYSKIIEMLREEGKIIKYLKTN